MYWYLLLTSVVAVPSYVMYRKRLKDPVTQLNSIKTKEDVLEFIRDVAAKTSGTETMVEKLVELIEENAESIHNTTITRLSKLAQSTKECDDMYSYAITILWSCVVSATSEHVLLFSESDESENLFTHSFRAT
jgi:hypothetical protein